MTKAATTAGARNLTDIPNIGVSVARDLCSLGIQTPADVKGMDPVAAYDALRMSTGGRHDPCVLDILLAAKKFMNGGPKQPWWEFTEQRKKLLAKQSGKK